MKPPPRLDEFKPFRIPEFRVHRDDAEPVEPDYHVGSSDAGAILGFGMESAADRWARIIRLRPRYSTDDKNRDTRRGRIFEAAIIGEWARIHRPAKLLCGPRLDEAPLTATDGWRTSRPDAIAWLETGECVYVEAKTTWDWWWDEETRDGWGAVGTDWVPKLYRCQGAWQLAVGWDPAVAHNPVRVDIAAFGMDQDYREYTIPHGPVVAWITRRVTEWMEKHVWAPVPTPPDLPSEDTLRHIYALGGRSAHPKLKEWLPSDSEVLEIAERLWRTRAVLSRLTERESVLKRHLMARIGNAYGIHKVASWAPSKPRHRFDVERFRREHPDMYRAYCAVGESTRTFRFNYRPKDPQAAFTPPARTEDRRLST